MSYYEEKISMKQKQVEIAKAGLARATDDYMQEVQNAILTNDISEAYEAVKTMAEKVNAGLALVKEIEEDVERLQKLDKEEKAKAESKED